MPLGAAPVGERGRKRDWAEQEAKLPCMSNTRPLWVPRSCSALSGLSHEAWPSQQYVGCRLPLEGIIITLDELPFLQKQEKTEDIDTWGESPEVAAVMAVLVVSRVGLSLRAVGLEMVAQKAGKAL